MQFRGIFSIEDRSGVLEAHCGRTRENGHKLEPEKFWQDIRNIVFIVRLVQHWNSSPEKLWPYCFFFSGYVLLQVPLKEASEIVLTAACFFWYSMPIPNLLQDQCDHGQELYTRCSRCAFDKTDPTWNEDGSSACSSSLLGTSSLWLTPPSLSRKTSFCLQGLTPSPT